jgi:WD40 repeat protein
VNYQKLVQGMVCLALVPMLMTGCGGGQAELTKMPTSIPATPTPLPELDLARLTELKNDQGPVYSLTWSPEGNVLAAAGYGQVKLWNVEAGEKLSTLEGHTSYVWGVAWSPDGRMLASASEDGTVRLWDAKIYEELTTLETGWAFCVAWLPDGGQLAVGDSSGQVQVWDIETSQLSYSLKRQSETPIISTA